MATKFTNTRQYIPMNHTNTNTPSIVPQGIQIGDKRLD